MIMNKNETSNNNYRVQPTPNCCINCAHANTDDITPYCHINFMRVSPHGICDKYANGRER